MRTILFSLAALLHVASATSLHAEQRLFLVANDADGYGIDRCLASGERCGSAAANAYCRMQAFAVAATYHMIDQGDIAGATAERVPGNCKNGKCDVVAIVCLR